MKNNHGKNCGNTLSILNELREPDHEFVEMYTEYKRLVHLKVIITVAEICSKAIIDLKKKV